MSFGLTNAPVTFKREINRILRPLIPMELCMDTMVALNGDRGMVVVASIDDSVIATIASLKKHH
jgi:hypothetical protein